MNNSLVGDAAEKLKLLGKKRRTAVTEEAGLVCLVTVLRNRCLIPRKPVRFVELGWRCWFDHCSIRYQIVRLHLRDEGSYWSSRPESMVSPSGLAPTRVVAVPDHNLPRSES